jgi:hypothetical protein
MPSVYIQDGFTLRKKIPAHTAGLYPAARITYRPAGPDIRFEYQDTAGAGGAARFDCAARIISRQVVEFAVDDGSHPAPVKLYPEQVKKYHADLFMAVFNAVMGFSDPDREEQEDAEKNSPTPSASG